MYSVIMQTEGRWALNSHSCAPFVLLVGAEGWRKPMTTLGVFRQKGGWLSETGQGDCLCHFVYVVELGGGWENM